MEMMEMRREPKMDVVCEVFEGNGLPNELFDWDVIGNQLIITANYEEIMDEEEMIIITKKGQCIHIDTKDVSAIGRATSGIKAIKLAEDDEVLVGLPIKNNADKQRDMAL